MEIVADPKRRWLNTIDPGVDDGQRLGHIEKRVGLLFRQDLLKAGVDRLALLLVKGAPPFFEQFVHLGILKRDKIQFLLSCLARMPDIILIRFKTGRPAKDCGLEVFLINKLVDKCGPLDHPDLHPNADLFKPLLNYYGRPLSYGISLIRHHGKLKGLLVLVQYSISVAIFPTGFFEQGKSLGRIKRVFFNIGVIEPEPGLIGPGCRHAQSQEDHLDDLLLINGIRERLPHPLIFEFGIQEIIPQIGIGVRQVTVLVIALLEKTIAGLALVLDRRQAH